MAVGSDSSLRMPMGSPLRPSPRPAAPQQHSASSGYRPFAINDRAVADMANNQRAAGVGAGAAAMRAQDRAGISRGKGQQYMADIAEAAGMEGANAAANATESAAAAANQGAQRAYENTRESERIANEGLLERLRSAQASEQLARRGNAQDMYEAYRRGQFGLDSQRLDLSPLLSRLFDNL
jgi:hypothetical protein